jgi:hypothetical protein
VLCLRYLRAEIYHGDREIQSEDHLDLPVLNSNNSQFFPKAIGTDTNNVSLETCPRLPKKNGTLLVCCYVVKTKNDRGEIDMLSEPKSLTVPQIALIAVTRGAIGFGAGLLLADKFKGPKRKTLGWSLFLSGLASTIPIAMHVFKRKPSVSEAI